MLHTRVPNVQTNMSYSTSTKHACVCAATSVAAAATPFICHSQLGGSAIVVVVVAVVGAAASAAVKLALVTRVIQEAPPPAPHTHTNRLAT